LFTGRSSEEDGMAPEATLDQMIVGLYESKGYAQDARNRLKTEGVRERDIGMVVLRDIAPVPSTSAPELEALSVDPLVLGDVEKTFATYIKNGETAVIVRANTEADAKFAADIMALYAPLTIERLPRRSTD
jgi:hypothetical protein